MKKILQSLGYIIIFLMGAFILWDYGRHQGHSDFLALCVMGVKVTKIEGDVYTFRPISMKEYAKRGTDYYTEVGKLRKEFLVMINDE